MFDVARNLGLGPMGSLGISGNVVFSCLGWRESVNGMVAFKGYEIV